ncbi:hypothetical protein WV31_10700 [Magnetospirillum sp. ME-1]|uniref:hypothetical protein n=1 Tax=Magnetospirillum sp. ME-1 TaxID=1639348 RepID=UPI000A17D5CC|nr:hypothetical protein [Magnetospirillum sp. ME-1]ARJ66096.1 hypothetical protein WV31_10700 [Magnetospirillum sp. ME-1]
MRRFAVMALTILTVASALAHSAGAATIDVGVRRDGTIVGEAPPISTARESAEGLGAFRGHEDARRAEIAKLERQIEMLQDRLDGMEWRKQQLEAMAPRMSKEQLWRACMASQDSFADPRNCGALW